MTTPREAPERWGLAHNDCSKLVYTGLHPDDHLSESTVYRGSTLMATRENILYESYPMIIPSGAPERWRLAHNDCSESAYMVLYLDGHPSESTTYIGPVLTLQGENSLYGSYPDGYPLRSPRKLGTRA